MIEITFNPTELTLQIEGHAGYAEKGKDIVCSAVSILFYTLGRCLSENEYMLKDSIVNDDDGNGYIMAKPKDKFIPTVKTFFYVTLEGFKSIAETYPDYVVLK